MSPMPGKKKFSKVPRKRAKPKLKAKRRDPIFIDGVRPRPMYVDYKDLELMARWSIGKPKLSAGVNRVYRCESACCYAGYQACGSWLFCLTLLIETVGSWQANPAPTHGSGVADC